MDANLRAVIDETLAKARSAETIEEAKAAYEEVVAAMFQAYQAVLTIVNVGLQNENEELKNEILAEADESTAH